MLVDYVSSVMLYTQFGVDRRVVGMASRSAPEWLLFAVTLHLSFILLIVVCVISTHYRPFLIQVCKVVLLMLED